MKKKRLTAVLAVLACACIALGVWAVAGQIRISELNARISELESMQNTETVPAASVADPSAVAAEFNGGIVTAAEAAQEYSMIKSYYEMMGVNEAEYAENAKITVLDGLIENKILEMKAREAGVYELTDAQKAEIAERVKVEYEDNIQYYMAFRFDESKTDAQVREETIAYLDENGYSYENMLADAQRDAWKDNLFNYVTRNMAVTDEQMRTFYDEQVATAEMVYSADFSEYEMDASGGRTIVWNPEGVRRIRYILSPFDEEQAAQYLILQAALANGDSSRLDELESLYNALVPKAQEILDRAVSGESFQTLLEEYAGSSGEMYVSERSVFCGDAFRDAAMALAKVGDYSGLVRTDGGICILYYAGDVPAGKVPFEDVKDALLINYEAELKSSQYNAAVVQWINEADIKYHTDVF